MCFKHANVRCLNTCPIKSETCPNQYNLKEIFKRKVTSH